MISKEVHRLIEAGSAIRRMWADGSRLKEAHGERSVADMTLGNPMAPPPEALLRALEDVLRHPPPDLHRYTSHAGHPEVRERIAESLHRRHLLPGAGRNHVTLTSGAGAALNISLRAVLDPGDEVILLAPYFPDYPAYVMNHQGIPRVVPTGSDFLPDLEAVARALCPRTRALMINHPNNPSARQYPEPLLRELTDLLRDASRRNGRVIYLISDEPYREICYTTQSFASPVRHYEHGIMAYSFSKSLSVPGERIGYIAISPEGPAINDLSAALSVSTRILGFVNAPSLWQRVIAQCLDAVVDLEPLRRHRARLLAALEERGYEVTASDGTFYLFPRTPGGNDEAFVRSTMKELLLLVPGGTFGRAGHFRMAYCVDEHTVDLAVERLPQAAQFS